MPLKNKVIFLTITNDPLTDRRMIRICNSLARFGAEVHLIGVQRVNIESKIPQFYKTVRIKPLFKKGFLFYLEFNIRIVTMLIFKRFDIISSVDTDTIFGCKMISILRNRKLVFDAHEYFTGLPELKKSNIKRGFWKLIEKLILPYISSNYTVSDSVSELYEKETGRNYMVIGNFPSLKDFENINQSKNKSENTITIAYIGFINDGRGIEQIIEVMKLLPDYYRLKLIGGGMNQEKIRQKCKVLGLLERVNFMGWISPDYIASNLQDADIGINLLDGSSLSYKASLANKVFDYIHLAIPSINMNFPEYKKLNDKYDCLYLISDIEISTIYNAIIELKNNEALYHKLHSNCVLASKELNWEKEEQKLINIYK